MLSKNRGGCSYRDSKPRALEHEKIVGLFDVKVIFVEKKIVPRERVKIVLNTVPDIWFHARDR